MVATRIAVVQDSLTDGQGMVLANANSTVVARGDGISDRRWSRCEAGRA